MSALNNIRIARISTVAYFVATQLKAQVEQIADEGAEVVVVTSPGPELSRIAWRENLSCVKTEIPREFNPLRDAKALFELVRTFRSRRFHVVHSTTPKAGMLSAIAAWLCNVPVRLHTFTGQPWVTLSGPVAWAAKAADRLICRLNTHCYADSPSQRQFLIDAGIARPDKISVIGSGSLAGVDHVRFDPTRFSEDERRSIREELGIGPESRIVLFLGRICRDKGVVELLDAFDELHSTGQDAHLLLVGPFDERQDPKDRLAPTDILARANVHHVDYTSTPERYLAVADLLCLPSYREGFGTVIIEAAAMGVPSIGTQIYGVSDAIVDGVTGVLVPAQDSRSLAAALRRVLGSSELLDELGRAARTRSQAEFDARLLNDKIIGEYRKFLDKT